MLSAATSRTVLVPLVSASTRALASSLGTPTCGGRRRGGGWAGACAGPGTHRPGSAPQGAVRRGRRRRAGGRPAGCAPPRTSSGQDVLSLLKLPIVSTAWKPWAGAEGGRGRRSGSGAVPARAPLHRRGRTSPGRPQQPRQPLPLPQRRRTAAGAARPDAWAEIPQGPPRGRGGGRAGAARGSRVWWWGLRLARE